MKKINKIVPPISDSEYSKLLREIAVKNGLQIPVTVREIAFFEEQFADEILSANQSRPSLNSMLSLARKIEQSGKPIVHQAIEDEPDAAYAMAARNGKGVNADTLELMEKALQKAREKNKDGD